MRTDSESMLVRGEMFAGCAIDQLLGIGGMSMVYGGTDLDTGERVAIKVPKPGFSIARFDIEWRVSSQLQSPSIVRVFRKGEERGIPYLVMELVPYPPLAVWMEQRRGPFPDRDIIRVGAEVAEALDHALGITGILAHRDVKPGNIFVDFGPGGESRPVKLGDFGIVKTAHSGLTGPMDLLGVAEYIAPEVILRQEYTFASDMYALGIVLYAMATGYVPFTHSDMGETLRLHLTKTPEPPRRLNPALSPALEAVILRCLAKDPRRRFPSLKALAGALREAEEGRWPAADAGGEHTELALQGSGDKSSSVPAARPSSTGSPMGILLVAMGSLLLFLSLGLLLVAAVLVGGRIELLVGVLVLGSILLLGGLGCLGGGLYAMTTSRQDRAVSTPSDWTLTTWR